jgi:hypothetical protein
LKTLHPILPYWVHWLEKTNDLLEYWSQKNSEKFGFQAYWSIASPRFHLRTWKKKYNYTLDIKLLKVGWLHLIISKLVCLELSISPTLHDFLNSKLMHYRKISNINDFGCKMWKKNLQEEPNFSTRILLRKSRQNSSFLNNFRGSPHYSDFHLWDWKFFH